MKNDAFKLEKRDEIGGGKACRLRGQGLIPAVVYGKGTQSAAAYVKGAELREFLKNHGRNSVIDTEFAEEHDFTVLLKDIQYDPVRKDIVHVDFQRVSSGDRVQVEVPVRVIGREKHEKEGNVVVHQLQSVRVECLPGDIPQYADADIIKLKPGNVFTAGDFVLPQSITLLSKPAEVILTIGGHEHATVPEA